MASEIANQTQNMRKYKIRGNTKYEEKHHGHQYEPLEDLGISSSIFFSVNAVETGAHVVNLGKSGLRFSKDLSFRTENLNRLNPFFFENRQIFEMQVCRWENE